MKHIKVKQIQQYIKKEMRKNAKKRKWCAKHYPDWIDNEYNAFENQFVWGVTTSGTTDNASFFTLNKIQIYFNRATKLYYLDLEPKFLSPKQLSKDDIRAELLELEELNAEFITFLIDNNLRMKSAVPYFYGPNFSLSFEGHSPTELYTKFRIMLEGYKWYRYNELASSKPQE